MSRAPWVVPKPERGFARGPQTMHDTALGWRLVNPRMEELHSTESMGETGENVAERYGITRERQDAFALRSHQRAVEAAAAGRFDDELVAVEVPAGKRGETSLVEADEGPRARREPGGPRQASPRLSRGRHGHRRQRVDSERRRRVPGHGLGGEGGGARREATRPGCGQSASPASTPPSWASARSRRSRAR